MAFLVRIYLFIGAGCLMVSCQQQELPSDLVGSWKAQSLVVSDSVWEVDIVPITLDLDADGQFTLHWYGGITESGKFTWSNNWMGIQSPDRGRRKLRVTHFGMDSLALAGTLQDQRTEIGFTKSYGE